MFSIKGIFDVKENIGKSILGYKVIGDDSDLANYVGPNSFFLITVGQIKSAAIRMKIAENLKRLNANFATVVSPRAYVSKHAQIGLGTIVLHDALVNANAVIGQNCIINTKSLIEHDSKVGDFCHISTAAVINGNCVIEDESFLGSNCVLKEGLTVPTKSIIRAGSFFYGK